MYQTHLPILFHSHSFFIGSHIVLILELRGQVSKRLNTLTKGTKLKRDTTQTGTQGFTAYSCFFSSYILVSSKQAEKPGDALP